MSERKPKSRGFTDDEKAAMREAARERKAGKSDESVVLAKLAAMPEPDRGIGKRLHNLIKTSAPTLSATTWYGMPAYAKDGKTICFYQNAHKFKTRYGLLGFSDKANLDEGGMWPVYYALKELTATEEVEIVALLKKALG